MPLAMVQVHEGFGVAVASSGVNFEASTLLKRQL